jgi:hypothetical protein
MTERLPVDQLKSRTRRMNDVLRAVCSCPLCQNQSEGELRVVKWRRNGFRMECPLCGLRFTIDWETFDEALNRSQSGFWAALAQVVYEPEALPPRTARPAPAAGNPSETGDVGSR